MYSALDDITLIGIFCSGDQEAFSELVNRYSKQLISIAYNIIGDEASDITQEVFIRLHDQLKKGWLPNTPSISSWLFHVSTNLAIDFLRKHQPAYLEKEHLEELIQVEPNNNIDFEDWLCSFIVSLPATEKAIFQLYFLENFSTKQVANICHKSPPRIYQIINEIKEKIKENFEKFKE